MKKTSLAISIVCMAICSTLSAQKNFQPGSVIIKSGKVIMGEINYKNWERNPRKILFRELSSASALEYDASSISGFEVAGDVYKSAIVEIDRRYDDVKRLSTVSTIESFTDTVFLKVLVAGNKPLYHFYDNVDHFYIANNDSIELLKYKKYSTEVGSGGRTGAAIQVNRQYYTQLNKYLQDCSSISDSLVRTKYEAQSLMKALGAYYNCTSTAPTHIQTLERSRFEIGLLGGVAHSTLKIWNTTPTTISSLSYPSSTDVTGGIFFDLVFPRNRERISINNELIYTTYNTEAVYTTTTPTTFDTYTYHFGYSYIRMNNMFRYRFMKGPVTLYFNAGIANGIVIKEKNTVTQYHKVGQNERTTVETGLPDSRKHEFGFLAGLGAKRNRVGVELRVDRSNGITPYSISSSSVLRYFALISFRVR